MHPFWNWLVQVCESILIKLKLIASVEQLPTNHNCLFSTSSKCQLKQSFIHNFQYFPRWVAPNLMTFAGFLLTALNFVMLSYYDWDFFASTDDDNYKPIPNWFWLFASVNIFLAYTLGEFFSCFIINLMRSHFIDRVIHNFRWH